MDACMDTWMDEGVIGLGGKEVSGWIENEEMDG